jgi:hypothetical protein
VAIFGHRQFKILILSMLEDYIRSIFRAPPSQRRIREDLRAMAAQTKAWRDQVIPWEQEDEMELLSLNREFKWVKLSMGKMLKGVFKSIYQEPMMTYGYKVYLKEGRYALCYAATSTHQFIYQRQNARTDFFIDGDHAGYITKDWLLYSPGKRLLGRRNRYSPGYYTVVIWDQEVAHLRDPQRVDRVNPRVFEIFERMGEKERLLLLAVTFLTMIEESHGMERA